MADHVVVHLGTATTATRLFEPICHLYDAAFSQPPFRWTDDESAHHREMLNSLRTKSSFGIATAEQGEQLVGFAYGYTLPVDTSWWTDFTEPLSAEITEEWDGRTFALIDLAVEASWRRRGVGRKLIDTLLAGRAEQRAVLSVQPTATETHAFYRNLGWTKIGTRRMPDWAVSPTFDIYTIPLDGNRAR